jgi:hypothetical protein
VAVSCSDGYRWCGQGPAARRGDGDVRGKLYWLEKLWRWRSPCWGGNGGDSLKSDGGGDSPASGCGQEAREWWGVPMACVGGREEGAKRSVATGWRSPLYRCGGGGGRADGRRRVEGTEGWARHDECGHAEGRGGGRRLTPA